MGAVIGALGVGIVVAAPKHTFTAGTPISASEMNENFSDLDSRLSAVSDTASMASIPVGGILSYAGNPVALPSNWVPCDGRTILQPASGLIDYDLSSPGLQLPLLNDDRFLMGTSIPNMGTKGGDNSIAVDGAHVHTWGQTEADLSWTYTGDVVRTAIAASRTAASWGRAWHVPSTTMSTRAMAQRLCAVGNLPAPQLVAMSGAELAALAAGSSVFAAVVEMLYLVERPAVLDAIETAQLLGVTATPFDEVLRDTLR